MPRLQITHRTEYAYQRPVGLLRHRLLVRPQDSHDLRLHAATLTVDPPPSATVWAHDVFGNSICLLDWPEDLQTEHLTIVSELELTHYPSGLGVPATTLDPAAETFPFAYPVAEIPDVSRLAERQYPDPAGRVDRWARRFVTREGDSPPRTLEVLSAMTRAVKAEFAYQAREAEGTQLPAETLQRQSGTCRDFALLMMEAARSLGLAARFVTGYLYDADAMPDPAGQHGAGATHAWCAIYLPGAGWVEYDPTNGLLAGANLVRVGVSRTPEQALPVSGGFLGDAEDPLGLRVDVEVMLLPRRGLAEAA
ncbi:transglutaminase family protein [Sediminicoccus rosea]|jgi:transglutaminase-like putative cysteine protease|uniref:Transglutaminase family protein n=1 Tax=Sediminicoccus rosea TaxID=1225128 RepID=A0ABZ0PN07_9PROT|nr:transglutaminase family protein [Sediminicoccus rosea]WPB86485.1 transglutaminase family protein [Sediminicoccus rosea]